MFEVYSVEVADAFLFVLVWWGGYMRGIVHAFEAKLNKFLKFYAISIFKIEMLIYR